MRGRLFVLSGPDVGRSFDLRHGDTLGRSPDCIVAVRHASVSRRHAHIELVEGEFWVVDDGSRNGVQVEGQRVERLRLTDHLEFALGELSLRFRVEETESPAAAVDPVPPLEATAFSASSGPGPQVSALDAEVADWDDGITIEEADEIEIAPATAATSATSATAARSASAGPQNTGRRILQYHRVPNESGLAVTELSQHPLWVRWSVYALALALTAALFFAAFKGTAFLKGRSSGAAATEVLGD